MVTKKTAEGAARKIVGDIGVNLYNLRTARGVSRPDLADKLGVSREQLAKYEHGKDTFPAHRVPAICDALEISPGDLFAGTCRHSPPAARNAIDAASASIAIDIAQLPQECRRTLISLVRKLRAANEAEARRGTAR